MNNNVLELLDGLNQNEVDSFIGSTRSSLNIKKIENKKTVDYTWVDKVYEVLPYLDTIIRHPRSFITPEEEIVIVEKAKKVNTESIKHLAQNTNLIQNIDDNGFVRPKKLLNIRKEETNDLYENRFIFTLVKRLATFVYHELQFEDEKSEEKLISNVTYNADTKYNDTNVKVNLVLETSKLTSTSSKDVFDSYKEKMEYIGKVVNDYENSVFMKNLVQVTLVKSPIRKTNVILKDKNFRKALELWEYLDNFELNDPVLVTNKVSEEKDVKMNSKYDLTYYLNFLALENLNKEEKENPENLLKLYISKLIFDYVDDMDSTERQFKSFINKEFKEAKKEKTRREEDIYECFKLFSSNHEKNTKSAFQSITSDFRVDKENYML